MFNYLCLFYLDVFVQWSMMTFFPDFYVIDFLLLSKVSFYTVFLIANITSN